MGRMLGKNHATILHSNKTVKNMLLTNNSDYVDEIFKWADILDEVTESVNTSSVILQQRVESLLTSMTSDRYAMIQALEELTKKIKNKTTDQ